MKTYVLVGVGIFVILLSLVAIFWDERSITNYPPKNTKIVAFGDSLVFGLGAKEGSDFVSILGKKLGRSIVNLGVSGDTTADGLNRVGDVLREDPGIVILLLGGNDYLRRIPKENTQENLGSLIETFIENGSVVILLGVRGGIILDGREEMFEELSKKYGTLYVEDVLSGIFHKPELMFDRIHPNDAGYAIIADRLYDVFERNYLQ